MHHSVIFTLVQELFNLELEGLYPGRKEFLEQLKLLGIDVKLGCVDIKSCKTLLNAGYPL